MKKESVTLIERLRKGILKKYKFAFLIIFSLIFATSFCYASTYQVFYDGFEIPYSESGWNVGGNATLNEWIITTLSKAEGTNSSSCTQTTSGLRYSSLLSKNISVSNYANISLTFSRSLVGLDANDRFKVSYWNGTDYETLYDSKGATANFPTWANFTYFLPNANGLTDFSVMFECDTDGGTEFCRIDGVNITANNTFIPFCNTNWALNSTSCGTNQNSSCGTYDNYTIIYTDTNNCIGNLTGLPSNNGTCQSCDYCSPSWYCGSFAPTCVNYWKNCNYINGENATNFLTCCDVTNLESDCNFTGDLGQYKTICGNMVATFLTNSDYPYIDVNTTTDLGLIITINGTKQNIEHLFMEFPTISQTFNWSFNNATEQYDLSLIFNTIGDYPFVIWSDYPYGVMPNITGTLYVRSPYYLNIEVYEINPQNTTNHYILTNSYITAEFLQQYKGKSVSQRELEQYLRPISFQNLFRTRVFHSPYISGQAQLKLWEKNTTYAFRLIDGVMTFPEGVYSNITMTKDLGTKIYLGNVAINNTGNQNQTIQFIMTNQELRPYLFLLNTTFIIFLVLIWVFALGLVFAGLPIVAYYSGITLSIITIILRIALWLYLGY